MPINKENLDPATKEWLKRESQFFVDRRGRKLTNEQAMSVWDDPDYRRVSKDNFKMGGDDVEVSTVFLTAHHPLGLDDPNPRGSALYETLVFGGPYDQFMMRYKNAAEASKGHEAIVKALKEGKEPPFKDVNIFKKLRDMLNNDQEGEEWKQGKPKDQ